MSGRIPHLCYTDGSAKAGEGAPGGWGFVIRPPSGPPLEGHGKARGVASKTMEYRAVAEALAALPDGAVVSVRSDNQPLVESLAKNLDAWRARGFRGVDPLVIDSVRRIAACIVDKGLTVEWQWVRGHNGNAGNERADALAAEAAREARAEIEAEAKRTRRR